MTRSGFTLTEFVIIFLIVTATGLILLVAISRAREQARMVNCRRNLSQVGFGIALYDQVRGKLPEVGSLVPLESPAAASPRSPLELLLETLKLPDLTELADGTTMPNAQPGLIRGEIPIPGFVCPADRHASAEFFAAPISYRACTGDTPAGNNGAFAVGGSFGLKSIEARDGLGYTAAFSERLVGDGVANHIAPENYAVVAGPLSGAVCPEVVDPAAWRGDAGSFWTRADFRSTLYTHAFPPGSPHSAIARDGQTAFMGASSGHARGTHLLLLDSSVSLIRPTIEPSVWRQYATVDSASGAKRE
jgi:hypothetical protein